MLGSRTKMMSSTGSKSKRTLSSTRNQASPPRKSAQHPPENQHEHVCPNTRLMHAHDVCVCACMCAGGYAGGRADGLLWRACVRRECWPRLTHQSEGAAVARAERIWAWCRRRLWVASQSSLCSTARRPPHAAHRRAHSVPARAGRRHHRSTIPVLGIITEMLD